MKEKGNYALSRKRAGQASPWLAEGKPFHRTAGGHIGVLGPLEAGSGGGPEGHRRPTPRCQSAAEDLAGWTPALAPLLVLCAFDGQHWPAVADRGPLGRARPRGCTLLGGEGTFPVSRLVYK